MAEPIDLDEIFSPYAAQNQTRMKGKDNTSILDIAKNAFKEGKGGYVLGAAGAATAGVGIKKAWDKSVNSNLVMVKEAAKAEAEALSNASKSGLRPRAVTLNRPLMGVMTGATSAGAALPTTEANQIALAKDITRSKWLRPFGLGQYADSALNPKLEIRPTVIRPAMAGEKTLGLTGYTEAPAPRNYVVSASSVPAVTAEADAGYSTTQALNANLPREGLPLNAYQKGARGLFNLQYGNAGIPLNSFGNVGTSIFKSGAGLGALTEGITAAYDTWPEFLGGSGNNVYGRTVQELRRKVNPKTHPFAYNVVAPIGGGLSNLKRYGWGAANAGLAGIPWMINEMIDEGERSAKVEKQLADEFEKDPSKFNPDEEERQRLRRIELGQPFPSDDMPKNTREAFEEYYAKVRALEEKKKSKK